MSDASATITTNSVSREHPPARGASTAKYLVTFIFLINVCFAAYMAVQFFVPKTYGNGLHAIYTTTVFATTVLLGIATRRFWTGYINQGTYCFFGALAVSFVGNSWCQMNK